MLPGEDKEDGDAGKRSKAVWTWSWAASLGEEVGVGPDDLEKSLSTPDVLWFCALFPWRS